MRKVLGSRVRGQALVEYSIIIPGAVILVIAVALLLGPSLGDIYLHVTSLLSGHKPCVVFNGAEDDAFCDQHDDCLKSDYAGEESGSFTYEGELSIDAIVIKAGIAYEIRRDDPYQFEYVTDDGCYKVTFKTNHADWEKIGTGPDCQGVSHVDYWSAPFCSTEE